MIADLVVLSKFKDVTVIVFFHFHVLICPEILHSAGQGQLWGLLTYTILLNKCHLVSKTYCEKLLPEICGVSKTLWKAGEMILPLGYFNIYTANVDVDLVMLSKLMECDSYCVFIFSVLTCQKFYA